MSDYEQWLEEICDVDTPENREWYECPLEECAEWLEKHPDYGDVPI